MMQGIRLPFGEVVEFESRYDLWPERIELLKKYPSEGYCTCRHDVRLGMTCVTGNVRAHMRRLNDLDQHLRECIFSRESDALQRNPDIFERIALAPAGTIGFQPGHFDALSRRLIEKAYHQAAIGSDFQVTLSRFFGQLSALVYSWPHLLAPSGTAGEIAAGFGCRIRIGLVREVTAPIEGTPSHDGYWPVLFDEYRHGSEWHDTRLVEVATTAVAEAAKRSSIYGPMIAGPYVAIGLHEQNIGRLNQIALCPVAIVSDQLAFMDSDRERLKLSPFIEPGQQVYKPMRRSDLNLLGPYCRSALRDELAFRYNPDLLIFGGQRPLVIEVCGFPDDETYMRSFVLKEKYWRSLEREGHIYYQQL